MVSYFSSRTICVVLLLASFAAWASPSASENIDTELGLVISNSYQYYATTTSNNVANLSDALTSAEQNFKTENYAVALRILATNSALHAKHLSEPNLQSVIRFALKLRTEAIVEKLLIQAKEQGNVTAEAILSFELSRLYANLENWDKVSQLLNDDSLFEQLSLNNKAEAYILLGTSLQKQKKHREAMQLYEKVSMDSEHFRLAQLNLATSYLRQDWWTDAFTSINSALKVNTKKRDALDYRLYTMLGYAQIQFGFYRDARESFRNIAISSQYAQRALLGLGVASLHQQDLIGALNAFDKLRTQPLQDISVAEAHLLSAFTLRQLEQYEAATNRYQEAISYYQQASSAITNQLNSTNTTTVNFWRTEHKADKLLANNAKKLALLESMEKSAPNATNNTAITNLREKIKRESHQHVVKLLQEEKKAIDSYLSQSRFGLASLYDHK